MATKYGTAREILDTTKELDGLKAIESDSYRFGGIQDKKNFRRKKEQLTSRVSAITPPPVTTDAERTQLMDRAAKLEAFIQGKYAGTGVSKAAMPPQCDQKEDPVGAVGRHISWENGAKNYTVDAKGNVVRAKGGYGALFEWKDIKRRLHPLEEQLMDPDTSNVEQLRSQSYAGRSLIDRPSMTYAPGAGVSQEKWDETFAEPDEPKKEMKTFPVEMQCIEVKANGDKCTGKKMHGKDYCLGHSRKHKEDAA
jgi:hypothetical protein